MSKKKIEKLQKEYTKPQLTHWERQNKTQRLVFFGGIGLIAVVVLGLVAAWFFNQIWPLYKTVIDVNGQKISMNQYIHTLKALGEGQSGTQLASVAIYADMYLQQAEIIRQGAAEQKITVTDDEVDAKLK